MGHLRHKESEPEPVGPTSPFPPVLEGSAVAVTPAWQPSASEGLLSGLGTARSLREIDAAMLARGYRLDYVGPTHETNAGISGIGFCL